MPCLGRQATPTADEAAAAALGRKPGPRGQGLRRASEAMRGDARQAEPFTGLAPEEGGVPPGRRRRWGKPIRSRVGGPAAAP